MKYYKTHFTPSLKSFQSAILPMQIVQIDDSPCDVFTADEEHRESLTAPNLTAAIDCYTGMVTGLSVSFFASSSRTILEVLVQSILLKDEYTNTYQTQHEWPIQGFPVIILVDNGMDYRAEVLKNFCKKHDIIIEFVPLRTPRYFCKKHDIIIEFVPLRTPEFSPDVSFSRLPKAYQTRSCRLVLK